MRPNIWFYPYSRKSKSVWNMVGEMDAMLIKRENSKYVNRASDLVVNWGCYGVPSYHRVLNSNQAVEIATSKLATYEVLRRTKVAVPDWTTYRGRAQQWANDGNRVLGRDQDRGSEGSGITIYEAGSSVGQHRFYCKYVRKEREFRVHVFQGRVIDMQEKLKRSGGSLAYVRNTANGYIFGRQGLSDNPCPVEVTDLAVRAVKELGLDFGGVDVGYSQRFGVFVYEVNTAPGIDGTTVTKYVEAIKNATM